MSSIQSDINNKLGPITNLIAMLKGLNGTFSNDNELNKLIGEEIKNVEVSLSFLKNIEFWKSINERPVCYKTGDWDGKMSDEILIELKNGDYVIGRCYEGFLDGGNFFNWEIVNSWELEEEEILKWCPIEL